jgi:hypothetical protein
MSDTADRAMTITAEVKLVIWDMDDMFWQGTLQTQQRIRLGRYHHG